MEDITDDTEYVVEDITDDILIFSDPKFAKLILKISRISIEYDLNSYEYACVNVIFQHLILYMRTFIRAMAKHKRKYNVRCPVLTGKYDNSENTVESEPVYKKLRPWQVKVDWDEVKAENINFIDGYDEDDSEDSLDRYCRIGNWPRPCEEDGSSKKRKKKEKIVIEPEKLEKDDTIISEIVESPGKFNAKNFIEFLRRDPFAIPLRSVCDILLISALERSNERMAISHSYDSDESD